MKRSLLSTLLILSLAACGARQAQPVAEQSDLDGRLSCAHLQGELQANTARLEELRAESDRRGRDSFGMILAAGVSGAVFLDTGSTQRTESEALLRRNARLEALITERRCPG
jgi:hypothetical protein